MTLAVYLHGFRDGFSRRCTRVILDIVAAHWGWGCLAAMGLGCMLGAVCLKRYRAMCGSAF
jgi:hypothetical protein